MSNNTPAPTGSARSPSAQGVMLGLGLAYFGAYQLFKLPVVLPVLLLEFGYDRLLAGAFMSIYAAAGLVLSVWVGRRITAQGPLGLVLTALGVMVLANLSALLAPGSGWLMLGCRALEGAAFAVLAISGPVLANQFANPRSLPIIIGLTAMWIPTGQLSATVLAWLGLAYGDWRWLWLVGVAGSVALALWCHRFLTRHPAAQSRRTGTAESSVLPATRRRALLSASLVFLLWSGQYFAYMTWLPQYVVEVHGTGIGVALLSYLVPVVVLMLFNITTGFALRAGVRLSSLLVSALVGQALVWWTLPWTGNAVTGLGSLLIYGVGAGIVPACLFAMPNALLGSSGNLASAFGVIMTGRNVGVLLGPVLLAQLFKWMGDWDLAAPVFGVWTTLAVVLAVLLSRQIEQAGPPDSDLVQLPTGKLPER